MNYFALLPLISAISGVFALEVEVQLPVKNIVNMVLGPMNWRTKSFSIALQLALDRKAKTFIETGTSRAPIGSCLSDGCSTYIFGEFNKFLNDDSVEMYSVDISEENCQVARNNNIRYGKHAVKVVTSDSVKFIEDWPSTKKIDFLYLDSFDFEPGLEIASQEHHLKEIMAAISKIHDQTIVLMDDCALNMGGKCAMVRKYLLANDWQIVFDGYQTVFVKNSEEKLNL